MKLNIIYQNLKSHYESLGIQVDDYRLKQMAWMKWTRKINEFTSFSPSSSSSAGAGGAGGGRLLSNSQILTENGQPLFTEGGSFITLE